MIYENNMNVTMVVNKLRSNMQFGLFGKNIHCYFEDGESVSYKNLWSALSIVYKLKTGHNKNLSGLCMYTFIGMTSRSYSKRRWRKTNRLAPHEYLTAA